MNNFKRNFIFKTWLQNATLEFLPSLRSTLGSSLQVIKGTNLETHQHFTKTGALVRFFGPRWTNNLSPKGFRASVKRVHESLSDRLTLLNTRPLVHKCTRKYRMQQKFFLLGILLDTSPLHKIV